MAPVRPARLTRRRAPRSRVALGHALADLGEQGDRPLEVVHRVVRATGVVEHVGEVVLDGRLEVAIADPPAGVDGRRRRSPRRRPRRRPRPARGRGRSRGDRGGRIRVVGGDRQAPLERGARRRQVAHRLRDEPDQALGHPARRGSSMLGRQVAGLGGRSAGQVQVAGAERDDAPLDQRPRPQRRVEVGRGQGGGEVAGGRREVAPAPMDAPERDLDGGQVRRCRRGRPPSPGRRSRPGTRRAATAARRSGRGRAAPSGLPRAMRGVEVVDRLAVGEDASARSAASTKAAAASAARPASRSWPAIRANRARSSRPPAAGSSRSASAVRRWMRRRRARLVAS